MAFTTKQKQKKALNTAAQLLDKYWTDGNLPVRVEEFLSKEGIDLYYVEGVPQDGKWREESEAIVVACKLTKRQERYAIARCLGVACGIDALNIFVPALLMPVTAFVGQLCGSRLTVKQASALFDCDYELCLNWASFLRQEGRIAKNYIFL